MYAPLPQKGMETGMKKFRIWILAALAAALCLLCGCSAEDFALPHEVQLAVKAREAGLVILDDRINDK